LLHRFNTGLAGCRYQDLYHFTVGRQVDDPRLKTRPAYTHRQSSSPTGSSLAWTRPT